MSIRHRASARRRWCPPTPGSLGRRIVIGIIAPMLIGVCAFISHWAGPLIFGRPWSSRQGFGPADYPIPFGTCLLGVTVAYGNLALNASTARWRDEYVEDALFRLARACITTLLVWAILSQAAEVWFQTQLTPVELNLSGSGGIPNVIAFFIGLGVFRMPDSVGAAKRMLLRLLPSTSSNVSPVATPEDGDGQTQDEASENPFPLDHDPRTVPAPPPELVEAIVGGKCVVFVGAGTSVSAGFPSSEDCCAISSIGSSSEASRHPSALPPRRGAARAGPQGAHAPRAGPDEEADRAAQ